MKAQLTGIVRFCDIRNMNAFPFICPACGELVIAYASGRDTVMPPHPDRTFPENTCPTILVLAGHGRH
jgi:hypothetical protein